jgi:hypothetical protein
MPDINIGMLTRDACLFKFLLCEYIILFNPSLSGKQLGRKTRLRVNGKKPVSKTNKYIGYLLRVEFLEDYTVCTSYSTTKFSLHS